MEAGERAEFRHRERFVPPEQLHRVHHPIIVDIAAEILSGVVVDGLGEIHLVGKQHARKVTQGEGLHQERLAVRHVPATPVVKKLVDHRRPVCLWFGVASLLSEGSLPPCGLAVSPAAAQEVHSSQEDRSEKQHQGHLHKLTVFRPSGEDFYFPLMASNPRPYTPFTEETDRKAFGSMALICLKNKLTSVLRVITISTSAGSLVYQPLPSRTVTPRCRSWVMESAISA